MVVLGANCGVLLNAYLSDLINGVLFIIFLCFVSPYLFKKGI